MMPTIDLTVCASLLVCQGEDTRGLYQVTTDCTSCRVPETLSFCPTCTASLRRLLAEPGRLCELCMARGSVVLVEMRTIRLAVPA